MFILVTTPVGRTELGDQIDYFPSRWSGSSGKFKVTTFYPFNLSYLTAMLKRDTEHRVRMIDMNYYGVDSDEYRNIVTSWDRLGDWSGQAPLELAATAGEGPGVVIVQRQGPAEILAAARVD